jgi:hypothetical protein
LHVLIANTDTCDLVYFDLCPAACPARVWHSTRLHNSSSPDVSICNTQYTHIDYQLAAKHCCTALTVASAVCRH